MELIPLFSGSSGNATLVRTSGANILIDAGKNCKAIVNALNEAGTDPCDIDAVLITHSHTDHVSGLDVFIRKYPSALYATEGTFRGMARRFTKPHDSTPDIRITPGVRTKVSDGVFIEAFATPHDAAGSVCYKITEADQACVVATDLGVVTDELKSFLKGADAVLLESNYDRHMLVYGPYPEKLKIRIAGDGGHISNDDCAEVVKYLIDNGTRRFILAHLSEQNNTPAKAESTVCDYLASFKLKRDSDYEMMVARRHEPTAGFCF